ncbi:MAG TPA: hypothetical protein VIH52_01520 [Candidatus Nanoarchaeia archaeon]|nr:hypothetical protein [uncultured archaeon]
MTNDRQQNSKSLLVRILQYFYLVIVIAALALPFLYQQQSFAKSLGFPSQLIWAVALVIIFYALLLFVSFLTQNSTLLILSLVLIFFTTILGLVLLTIAFPNLKEILEGNLPSCINNLGSCNFKDGIIVASAAALAVAVPLLVLNIITIVGAVKAIASND